MMTLIVNIAISIYLTSTIFMLVLWGHAFVTFYLKTGKIFTMPFGYFLYTHFCPFVHTVNCFKIMKRAVELKK